MKLDLQRTIVALSTGAVPSRRAVVRLSGQLTHAILSRLIHHPDDLVLLSTTVPRAAHVTCSLNLLGRNASGNESKSKLPAIVYYWPDQRSFTGEPCAELHVIGSMPIVEALIAHLCSLGASPAERGEFTLRSFLAGKLDLVQAEAVLGVIEADGPTELREALSHLGGNLSKPVRIMRDQLVELMAHLEAGLDFVEEDIEFISNHELVQQLISIRQRIAALTERLNTRDARSFNAQIVIVGLPNSGKSTLFNCLAGTDRAIVSPLAGTTRDAISQTIDLDGMTVELIDTAGIEELNEDSPRAEAQVALKRRLTQADLAIFCIDSSQPFDEEWRSSQVQSLVQLGVSVLTVGTKAELRPAPLSPSSKVFDLWVSVRTEQGIAELKSHLFEKLASHNSEFQTAALQHIAVRCRQAFTAAVETIDNAIELANSGDGEELVAAELRIVVEELSSVIGEVHSDDILGEIFSRFCIGK